MLRQLLSSWRASPRANQKVSPQLERGPTFEDELGTAGIAWEDWRATRRTRPCLYLGVSTVALEYLRGSHRDRVDACLSAAERILAHEFDLLGSRPFVPSDPDRPGRDGYAPIDWYLDPVRQLRFPTGVPHKQWKLYEMRPGNADVKFPWELARCQHWVRLGQAYQLTRDERFAAEIARELDDFVEANPIGVGINWTCTMDVALRAANWAFGLELVRDASELPSSFWLRAYTSLFEHGVFIRANLENTYEVTSNHFLSNVVGLWVLGFVFGDLQAGREWKAFSRDALEREMEVQILPDGADFESAIPYHRLVTELFLGCARLGDSNREPLSAGYRRRVRDMVAYLAGVLRPDGLMPQVGDADDGRLHVCGLPETPQDPRHVFGPAGMMFEEPPWWELGGQAGRWEATWWGLNPAILSNANHSAASDPPDTASGTGRLFPDAGVAVMRSDVSSYLLITNGIVGTKGFGNHKHNDQLSFEYHHKGVPLVVDPGSYVYTSDFDARNMFRGTAYHNTLRIDGVEQNEMRHEWLFRLFESSRAEHVAFDEHTDRFEYIGRHHGYTRLAEPVIHERTFKLAKSSGALTIVDRLLGVGEHEIIWHFHLAPDVEARREQPTTLTLAARGKVWQLTFPAGMDVSIRPAWYSPSYGVKLPCFGIDLTSHARLEGERVCEFSIES